MSYKNICIFIVLAFIFSFSVGMASMSIDDMGNMTGCPLMGMDTICQMGLFEHIGIFQNMFSGIPTKGVLLSILLVFLVVSFVAIPHVNGLPNLFRLSTKESHRLPSFNIILIALSDGRLQPKLYA
jgi:hypothetical protein